MTKMVQVMATRTVLVLAAVLGIAGLGFSQEVPVYPTDEATKDPDFFIFRSRVQSAIADRDTTFVLNILHPRILNSWGGSSGIAEFQEYWRLDQSDSRLWHELGNVLALGGFFRSDSIFEAPYTSRANCGDPFEYYLVVGSGVEVYVEPNLETAVLDTMSFCCVRCDMKRNKELWLSTDANGFKWLAVYLSDGRTGYIESRYVRSPIGYRAVFMKSDGKWKMSAFVAGD